MQLDKLIKQPLDKIQSMRTFRVPGQLHSLDRGECGRLDGLPVLELSRSLFVSSPRYPHFVPKIRGSFLPVAKNAIYEISRQVHAI